MRAILRCDKEAGIQRWDGQLFQTRIAGLPLLQRQLLAFRQCGIHDVEIWMDSPDRRTELIKDECRVSGVSVQISKPRLLDQEGHPEGPVLEQRADTLVDPRLLVEAISVYGKGFHTVSFVDEYRANYPVKAKSPYRIGTPGNYETRRLDSKEESSYEPFGLKLHGRDSEDQTVVHIGRYYWHRVECPEDVQDATDKVFLATMKQTDGVYARTNRRVSLRISKLLVNTPVTPNMMTLMVLFCSIIAGLLFSLGTYGAMVAGSLMSWFASMLDGSDGELARVRFQVSPFGEWFEMVCDYLYYILVFVGIGVGLFRQTGNLIWMWLGWGSVLGVVLSFAVIALLRRLHRQTGETSDFGLAYQQAMERDMSNPIHYFLRRFVFFATRAALPYYIVAFTILGIADWLMVLIFIGTNLVWILNTYINRELVLYPAQLRGDS